MSKLLIISVAAQALLRLKLGFVTAKINIENAQMTPKESKKLKVGTRVCFNGDRTDRGKVTAVESRYVKIKWADGHLSLTGHNGMARVELLAAKR